MSDLVLAMTGASGAPYGIRLLEVLARSGRTVHLVISPSAVEVLEVEMGLKVLLDHFDLADLLGEAAETIPDGQVHYHHHAGFQAGIASGSFATAGMVICPCSMNTVAAIAHGMSQNLIHRAADVHLKERRRLILVPRNAAQHRPATKPDPVRRGRGRRAAGHARFLHAAENHRRPGRFHRGPDLRPAWHRAPAISAPGAHERPHLAHRWFPRGKAMILFTEANRVACAFRGCVEHTRADPPFLA